MDINNTLKKVDLLTGGAWDKRHKSCRQVYSADGISPTLNCCEGGGLETKIIDPIVCASRGRGKENVQQLEAREDGTTNTITSVQKDNLVVLGWSRDRKGKVVNRHPVKVANAVTSGKRENTQNYVVEPINADKDGCATTLTGAHHYSGNIINPKRKQKEMGVIEIPQATKEGAIQMEIGGVADLSYPTSKTRRGRVQDKGTISPALTCHTENTLRRIEPEYRIRKLTPRESFRLMGVGEKDIDKLLGSGISNSQLYKLAGNSIVVNCLAGIFRQLFVKNENKVVQLEIF